MNNFSKEKTARTSIYGTWDPSRIYNDRFGYYYYSDCFDQSGKKSNGNLVNNLKNPFSECDPNKLYIYSFKMSLIRLIDL